MGNNRSVVFTFLSLIIEVLFFSFYNRNVVFGKKGENADFDIFFV